MKQYVKKTVVFILTASLMLLTGCQQPFDATGYTQAVLDMVTRGETKAYEAISESSEEEAKNSTRQRSIPTCRNLIPLDFRTS